MASKGNDTVQPVEENDEEVKEDVARKLEMPPKKKEQFEVVGDSAETIPDDTPLLSDSVKSVDEKNKSLPSVEEKSPNANASSDEFAFTISTMKKKHLQDVLDLIEYIDDDDVDAADGYFEECFKDREHPRDRHFVATVEVNGEKQIVGVCGALEDDDEGKDIWWLGWFYIDEKFRQKGIGTKLFESTLDWCREKNGRKLYVDVSALDQYAAARRFYEKNGFVQEGRLIEFYAPGEDQLILGRSVWSVPCA